MHFMRTAKLCAALSFLLVPSCNAPSGREVPADLSPDAARARAQAACLPASDGLPPELSQLFSYPHARTLPFPVSPKNKKA